MPGVMWPRSPPIRAGDGASSHHRPDGWRRPASRSAASGFPLCAVSSRARAGPHRGKAGICRPATNAPMFQNLTSIRPLRAWSRLRSPSVVA